MYLKRLKLTRSTDQVNTPVHSELHARCKKNLNLHDCSFIFPFYLKGSHSKHTVHTVSVNLSLLNSMAVLSQLRGYVKKNVWSVKESKSRQSFQFYTGLVFVRYLWLGFSCHETCIRVFFSVLDHVKCRHDSLFYVR